VDASPAGSTVTLQIIPAEDNGSLEIRIEDAGPGLGDRDPDELFEPFVTTKSRGTGLGLAISRQIIERLGGSLRLSTIAEGGARCTIQLPLR
jgi:signal transduction histidine kinase